jgi:hypothetical protein
MIRPAYPIHAQPVTYIGFHIESAVADINHYQKATYNILSTITVFHDLECTIDFS